MKTKQAFTLAEVLITLAIIGIIAAITIPSIIANHQKRTLETQFAKTYRTFQQMVNLSVAENGDISTWDWKESWTNESEDEFVKKYMLPYLNVMKFVSSGEHANFFSDSPGKRMNGMVFDESRNVAVHPKILLADGTAFVFYTAEKKILVDTNGAKKPNTVGYDIFQFLFYPKTGEFLPCGVNSATYDEATGAYVRNTEDVIEQGCINHFGWTCPAKIIKEGFKINY